MLRTIGIYFKSETKNGCLDLYKFIYISLLL